MTAAKLQGFSHLRRLHGRRVLEVGDGAGHAQHAVVAARREPEPIDRAGQKPAALCVGCRDVPEPLRAELGVGAGPGELPATLTGTPSLDPGSDARG